MHKLANKCLYRGAFGIAVAIILGALAAHALKDRLPEYNLQIFETAVKYQFYGCFGLLIFGILSIQLHLKLKLSAMLLRFGILIFSGTLYFLALRPLFGIEGLNWVGAITPFGGIAMITAWILLGIEILKIKTEAK
jgi:uncharacterized membrane protein YgdD (TMEM256/DUF423 family)